MTHKHRIDVNPVRTLGDLVDLLAKATAVVDLTMPNQSQADTPIKVEVTFGGRIKAVVLTEADKRIEDEFIPDDWAR